MAGDATAKPSWRQWLAAQWQRFGVVTLLLAPVSLLFGTLAGLRRTAYRTGIFKSEAVNAVVCVVGNIVAGGAGKTPTVIALVQHLQQQGIPVGVVSRGYGRKTADLHLVDSSSDARQSGDEPLLIHRRTGVPVVVGASRVEAARALLAQAPQTRVIVCDDGLQHYALRRDVEVCVFDDRGTGNGWLLPAGPLREFAATAPIAAAGQRHGARLKLATAPLENFEGHLATRKLSRNAKRKDGSLLSLDALTDPQRNHIAAVAGIARPERFFQMLRAAGIHPTQELALPDHFDFDSALPEVVTQSLILCTEKDAAKLWRQHPNALSVPLEQDMDERFWQAFDALIQEAQRARLSSTNGHTTA